MTPPPDENNPLTSGRGVDLFFGDDPEPDSAAAAVASAAAAPAAADLPSNDQAADAYDQAVESAYVTPDVTVAEADALQQSAGETGNGVTPAAAVAALPPPQAAAPPPPPPPVATTEKSSGGSSNGCLIGIGALLLGALLGAALALAVLFSTNSGLTYASRSQLADLSSTAGQLRASADALRGDVTALQGTLGSTQNDLDALGQRQETISQTIAGLAESQAAIDERLKVAEQEAAAIGAVRDQLDQTVAQVAGLEGSVADVTTQVGVMASELSTVTQRVQEVALSAQRSDNFLAGLTALLGSLDAAAPAATAPVTGTRVATPTVAVTTTITPAVTLTATVAPTPTVTLTPTIVATATVTPAVAATPVPTATVAPETTPAAPAGEGAIQGIVYFDRDQNGVYDGALEPGIAGVVVTLYAQDRTQLAETTTNFRGQFEFTNLAPGIYVVVETDPPNFLSSTPNNYTVRVLGATPIPQVLFGDYR